MDGIKRNTMSSMWAGCAGAATAMLLARLGQDVLLVDRARLPSDTVSRRGLARGGVVRLLRCGRANLLAEHPARSATFYYYVAGLNLRRFEYHVGEVARGRLPHP